MSRKSPLRWMVSLLWWNAHGWVWVRWHGELFLCLSCWHRFWAIPAQHSYRNACPRCLWEAARVRR